MLQKTDLAIVLRSIPYQDRHQIVTALSYQHGQIGALARNSIQSRRFGGALELFAASTWLFVEKTEATLFQLKEAQIRYPFEALRKDFQKLSMASLLNELMLKVAPLQQACPELFLLHSNALKILEEITDGLCSVALLNTYLGKLLKWGGSQPKLETCLECSIPLAAVHSSCLLYGAIAQAGWMCSSCHSQSPLSYQKEGFQYPLLKLTPSAIIALRVAMTLPVRQGFSQMDLSEEAQKDLFRFLEGLLIYHFPGFDRPLKSLRFLDLQSSWQLPPKNLRFVPSIE